MSPSWTLSEHHKGILGPRITWGGETLRKDRAPLGGHLDPKGRACRGHPEFLKQKTPSSKQSGQIFPFCSLLLPPILLIMRQITVVPLLIFSFAIPFPAFGNSSSPPPPPCGASGAARQQKAFPPTLLPPHPTPHRPQPLLPQCWLMTTAPPRPLGTFLNVSFVSHQNPDR